MQIGRQNRISNSARQTGVPRVDVFINGTRLLEMLARPVNAQTQHEDGVNQGESFVGLPWGELFTLGADRLLYDIPTFVLLYLCGACALTDCASVFVQITRWTGGITWANFTEETATEAFSVGPFTFDHSQYATAVHAAGRP